MRTFSKKAGLLVLCAVIAAPIGARAVEPATGGGPSRSLVSRITPRALAVRMAMQIRKTSLDCSHLVHFLYERAGLKYDYAASREFYEGVTGFKRVVEPNAGDLIIWRGHMGIVVDPEERTFVSRLRTGVKVSRYDSQYWKTRGRPRFFRYTLPATDQPEFWQSTNYVSGERGDPGAQ